jgi:hypothetical protein
MVFHVNPLNCATSAAWRVLAPACAITIKRAVAELNRVADVTRPNSAAGWRRAIVPKNGRRGGSD